MSALYQIEQAIAARCGPFLLDQAASATVNDVTLLSQQSTLDLGDQWTGLYVRRRGLIGNAGAPVAGFLADDRVRRIAAPINRASGKITVDRPWTVAPVAGETVELHYLDPLNELTVAALAGLDRCFILDRASVATTGAAAERDLTAAVSWLTELGQIYEIGYVYPGAWYIERPLPWWREFLQSGHVFLQAMPDPFPNNLLVTARRPASTLGTGSLGLTETVVVQAFQDASATTPIVITTISANAPYFQTGDIVTIAGVVGAGTDLIGTWQVTYIDNQHFSLNGSVGITEYGSTVVPSPVIGTATLTYVGDPSALPLTNISAGFLFTDVLPGTPAQLSLGLGQPFFVGETVRVHSNIGNSLLDGTWVISAATGDAATAGTITLQGSSGGHSASGAVTLWRPQFVAGQVIPTVPNADITDYPVSVAYATAWGVVSLWERFPHRLAPGAAAGRLPTREQANIEASLQAIKNFKPPAKRDQLSTPFSSWQTSRL